MFHHIIILIMSLLLVFHHTIVNHISIINQTIFTINLIMISNSSDQDQYGILKKTLNLRKKKSNHIILLIETIIKTNLMICLFPEKNYQLKCTHQ